MTPQWGLRFVGALARRIVRRLRVTALTNAVSQICRAHEFGMLRTFNQYVYYFCNTKNMSNCHITIWFREPYNLPAVSGSSPDDYYLRFGGVWVPNMPHAFKNRDVQRLIKAARSAGIAPGSVTIDLKGGIITVHGKADGSDSAPISNPWDEVLTNAADSKRPS